MAARPKTLRAAFEKLAFDFAGALIAAVAAAPMPDLIATFGSHRPATVRHARHAPPTVAVAAPRVVAAPPPRPRVVRAPARAPKKPKRVSRARDVEVETHADNAILDPAALLMMVEQAEEAPVSRVEARSEAVAAAPSRPAREIAPRPGQDVLRTTGGSLVLRRKRGANGAPRDAAE